MYLFGKIFFGLLVKMTFDVILCTLGISPIPVWLIVSVGMIWAARVYVRTTLLALFALEEGDACIAAIDSAYEYEESSETAPPAPKGPNLFRFAAVLAGDVKRKLGSVPKPTEANRLVAWDLLNKACEARDVRIVDRLRFMQVAVDLVFIGDQTDVMMTRVRRSLAVQDRLSELSSELSWGERIRDSIFGATPGLRFRSG